jgi:hypothetical protein
MIYCIPEISGPPKPELKHQQRRVDRFMAPGLIDVAGIKSGMSLQI